MANPNSASIPSAILGPVTIPNRPSDFKNDRGQCVAELWRPGPGELGTIVVREVVGQENEYHSYFCSDVRRIASTIREPTPLTPLFHHLGVTMQRTKPGKTHLITALHLSDADLLNAQGQALPLSAEHRLPWFERFEGTKFKAETQRDALLERHSFLIGMGEDFFVHDWMHMLGGLLLLSPVHMAMLRSRLRKVNSLRNRSMLTGILADIDQNAQPGYLASSVTDALLWEAKLPDDEQQWSDDDVAEVEELWTAAGVFLHNIVLGGPAESSAHKHLGEDLREHVHALGKAALTLQT